MKLSISLIDPSLHQTILNETEVVVRSNNNDCCLVEATPPVSGLMADGQGGLYKRVKKQPQRMQKEIWSD